MADPLLEPFQLKHLTLRNRIFSSAHEPAYSEEGMPKDRYRLYHEEKAKGGVALTMTAGSAVVAEDSPPAFGNLHAYDDAIVPWLQRLTDGVHEHGAACMIQISHLGRRTSWSHDDWLPVVAPSPIREAAHRAFPKQAEDWDIERIIGKYADAAERMQAGGMDGIEIESYGHLFDAFWSPRTNHRADEWGESNEARMRFPWEVLRAIRARVGDEFIVGLRMAIDEAVPDGFDTNVGLDILGRLEQDRLIDFINVIRGTTTNDVLLSEIIPIHGMAAAPHLDFAGLVRDATDLPVLHASKIDDVATARHSIAEGRVDLVGMTRAQMADPHLVRKIIDGEEARIRPCVGATYCLDRIYEAGEALCIHNAATSREATMPHDIPAATAARRVVIVGAGPAGLEAGRVAGERGHHVTVLEAMPWPGGQINLAARNLLYDDHGRHSALTAAEMIARSGAELEIVTPERMLGIDIGGMNHVPYARAFNETDTRITLNQRVFAVRPELGRLCVELGSDHSDHRSTRHVDAVVVDHGTQPLDELYFELKPHSANLGAVDYDAMLNARPQPARGADARNPDGAFELYRIGDAVASRNIHAAVFDALRLLKDV